MKNFTKKKKVDKIFFFLYFILKSRPMMVLFKKSDTGKQCEFYPFCAALKITVNRHSENPHDIILSNIRVGSKIMK